MKTGIFLLSFLSLGCLNAQRSLLPWSGAVCEKSGISCKEVEMELEDQTWTGNVLPIGKKLEISIEDPTGFIIENEQCFPGVSILVTKLNGDTLGYAPNIFPEGEGLDVSMLQNLSFSFSLSEDVKAGDLCRLDARFFDTKSSNYLQLKMDLVLGAEDEKPVSDMIYSYSSSSGYRVSTTLDIDKVTVKDSLIRSQQFTVVKLEGAAFSWDELNALAENMKVYSAGFNLLDTQKILPYVRISKKENPATKKYDIELLVPKNNDIAAVYWVYRLENKAAAQVIEIFNPF